MTHDLTGAADTLPQTSGLPASDELVCNVSEHHHLVCFCCNLSLLLAPVHYLVCYLLISVIFTSSNGHGVNVSVLAL